MKPTFIVIGAAKSGSTSLCRLISQHPHVSFSNPKEPRFFSHDENFQRGWRWYQSLFEGDTNALAIGEGSVHYSMRTLFPNTVRRIAEALPESKLIYIVRHPIDRIVSHCRMYDRFERNKRSKLNTYVKSEKIRPNLIDASKYWFQINAYRDYFTDDSIQVLFFEDFIVDPTSSVKQCYRFLDLEPEIDLENPNEPKNVAKIRVENRFIKTMRRSPTLFNTIRKLKRKVIPGGVSRRLHDSPLFTVKMSTPKWDPDVYEWVVDQVIEDAHHFLQFYGKPLDYWTI